MAVFIVIPVVADDLTLRIENAAARTATRNGDHEMARTASDIYDANATAEDLASAAKDLGLTEDDLAECENP